MAQGGVKFKALIRLVARGIVLPFGRIRGNRHSQVDLIACCVTDPGAPGRRSLVSDGDDLSTSRLLGRSGVAERWLGNLQVDMDLTCCQLEWSPPYTVTDGMAVTVSSLPESS